MQRLPSTPARPSGGIGMAVLSGVVTIVVAVIVIRLVLGVVFGLVSFFVPLALVVAGIALLATNRRTVGGWALGIGLLLFLF